MGNQMQQNSKYVPKRTGSTMLAIYLGMTLIVAGLVQLSPSRSFADANSNKINFDESLRVEGESNQNFIEIESIHTNDLNNDSNENQQSSTAESNTEEEAVQVTPRPDNVSSTSKVELSIESKASEGGATESSLTVNGEEQPVENRNRTQRIKLDDGTDVRLRIRADSENNNDSSVQITIKTDGEAQ